MYSSCNPQMHNSVSQDRLGYVMVINKMNILSGFQNKVVFFFHPPYASGKSMGRDILGTRETYRGIQTLAQESPISGI